MFYSQMMICRFKSGHEAQLLILYVALTLCLKRQTMVLPLPGYDHGYHLYRSIATSLVLFVVKCLGIYSNLLTQISTTAKAPRLIGLAHYLPKTFALQSPP